MLCWRPSLRSVWQCNGSIENEIFFCKSKRTRLRRHLPSPSAVVIMDVVIISKRDAVSSCATPPCVVPTLRALFGLDFVYKEMWSRCEWWWDASCSFQIFQTVSPFIDSLDSKSKNKADRLLDLQPQAWCMHCSIVVSTPHHAVAQDDMCFSCSSVFTTKQCSCFCWFYQCASVSQPLFCFKTSTCEKTILLLLQLALHVKCDANKFYWCNHMPNLSWFSLC